MRPPVRQVIAGVLASCTLVAGLNAQWVVGAEIGADRFWGGSADHTEAELSFRPYRPTTLGVEIQREWSAVSLGMKLGFFSAGMALEGPGGVSVAQDVFIVYSFAPQLRHRVASLGINRLILRAGPLLELWKVLDERTKARLGVQVGVEVQVPLSRKLDGVVSVGTAVVPSPFEAGQLDPPFERRALWRRSFGVALQYRL
jgi:hypothetical protein